MSEFLDALRRAVGDGHVLTDPDAMQPYLRDYRGRFTGTGLCVVRPADTGQVSAVVTLCAAHGVGVVPQGGNTGLVGGSIPYESGVLVLSLERMTKIRAVTPENFSMVVEAGCVLQNVQNAAREHDQIFPLSLASEGSARIGGCIAANAGGILTMRYGNCRDLVLGLEVVLPDGRIWHGLRELRKDNTGYDLKHLFIGSEGTLGVITAAVLKLAPDPGLRETVFAACDGPAQAVALLGEFKAAFGDNLLAFELIARRGVEFAVQYNPSLSEPLDTRAPWHVLVDIAGGRNAQNLRGAVEDALATVFEKGLIIDATIAQNEAQRQMFWTLRESVSDAQRYAGASIKHDISVPIAAIPDFIADGTALVEGLVPGVRPVIFGHLGDGNLHFNLTQPEGADPAAYLARWDDVAHVVHDIVQKYGGSFAAEHGVGTFKAKELATRKSPVELDMMRAVKAALDPQHLFNRGKILAE